MFFDNLNYSVKILTVQKLSWANYNSHKAPRKYHTLSYRLKGNASIICDNKNYTISDGETLFVPYHSGYHITASNEELYVIHFECSGNGLNDLEPFHTINSKHLKELFARCYDVWSNKKPGYYFRTLSIFFNILEQLNILLDISPDDNCPQLKPALDYVHKHFSDPDISVQKLCMQVSMSDTWFRKLFTQVYGTTPVKYINKLRITQACEMLESDYYSVEQVSEMVGFTDPKYFSVVFRQHTGHSPSKYKKKGYINI